MVSVSVKTYGCSNNFAESEIMEGILEKEGYSIKEKGDVLIFNMCSVKGPSVKHCIKEIEAIKEKDPDKKIILSGCVPKEILPELQSRFSHISVLNTHHIAKVGDVMKHVVAGNTEEHTRFDRPVKLNFPRRRKNPVVSIVPILSGCNDFCTYCYTKIVKGPTVSYPKKNIIAEVEQSIKDGCKEIWLTSQDNGAYNLGTKESGVMLPGLTLAISAVPGQFYIRVGMANPTYLKTYLDELIVALQHPKVYKFLHIPVQAGNDRVLALMNRRYTSQDYLDIVTRLKKEVPGITIATDIIVGFPGETEEEFEETLNLMKKTGSDVINISRFSPRESTRAAKMKQLPGSVLKDRSRRLTQLYDTLFLQESTNWIGKECYILISDQQKGKSLGRNLWYKPIVVDKEYPLGTLLFVRITGVESKHYTCEVLPNPKRLEMLNSSS